MPERSLEDGPSAARATDPPSLRRPKSFRLRWKPHVPSVCLMPLHAALLAALLLGGVLPLYYFSVRAVDKANNQITVVCGLYPSIGGQYTFDNFTWEDWPAAPPVPPAPPGARDIRDPAQCQQDFRTSFDYDTYTNSPWVGSALITFLLTVEDMDPRGLKATVRVLAYPGLPFYGPAGRIKLPPGIVLIISMNGQPADEFQSGDGFISNVPKKADDVPVFARPGLSHYPFDRYLLQVNMFMRFINTSDNNASYYVPFVAGIESRNPSFSFYAPVENSFVLIVNQASSFGYEVQIRRTNFTKAFSMFIFVSMWALTLYCVVHATRMYFSRDQQLGFDVPTYAATLLFALPAVREVQPGVPDVGAIIDIVGFFWNMVLLVLVCSLLLAKIYGNWKRGKPPKFYSVNKVAEGGSLDRAAEGRTVDRTSEGGTGGLGLTVIRDRSDIAEKFLEV